MAAAVVVPPLEFTASDLVKCTVTVNSTPLYGIIRGVLEALHGVKQHLESMDSKLEGMDERITANRFVGVVVIFEWHCAQSVTTWGWSANILF